MSKWLWLLFGALFLAALLALGAMYRYGRAMREAPAFYEAALKVDRAEQEAVSERMTHRLESLRETAERDNRWHEAFSENEINGWLAVEVMREYGRLFPGDVSNPRVQFQPGKGRLAFRLKWKGWDVVVTLTADVRMVKPNVVALQIRHVQAGILPIPLDRLDVMGRIKHITDQLEWKIHWEETDQGPIASITVPSDVLERRDREFRVESVEFAQGKLVVAGTTRPVTEEKPSDGPADKEAPARRDSPQNAQEPVDAVAGKRGDADGP